MWEWSLALKQRGQRLAGMGWRGRAWEEAGAEAGLGHGAEAGLELGCEVAAELSMD